MKKHKCQEMPLYFSIEDAIMVHTVLTLDDMGRPKYQNIQLCEKMDKINYCPYCGEKIYGFQ